MIKWRNETRKLSELIPWEHNPKRLDERQAEHLQASLEKFGLAIPLLISPENEIYDGHQRQALLDTMAGYGPDAEIDVRVSHRPLTDDERRELAIRLVENTADYDMDMLANLWEPQELKDWGMPEWKVDGATMPQEWPEYDESAADDVEFHECPECGHKWPK